MDAGLQIKDFAGMLGLTNDTAINWELRGGNAQQEGRQVKVDKYIIYNSIKYMMIAATAEHTTSTLVSLNQKHFPMLKNLMVPYVKSDR